MSFEEKVTWVSGVVTVGVVAWYAWTVGGRLGRGPVADVAYEGSLLFALGAMIVLTIVGTIAMSIATAIAAEVRGEDPDAIDRTDERDASIDARGDRVAFYVSSAFMMGVLALALLETDHFWIANGVFAGFVAAGLVGTAVKLVTYRRGY